MLETPLRDLSGDVIYEENTQGQLVPARRFSPDYWRDKYESHRLLQDVKQVNLRKQADRTSTTLLPAPIRSRREPVRWRDEWTQLRTLLRRSFIAKMRNRGNLIITTVVPPMLAALIAWTLYFTDNESADYDFASAFHIPTYIFMALLVAMFLALVNSVDDIIRDRVILNRERNLDVRLPYYILSKFLTLALFSAVQCALFVLVGNAILEIRGMFLEYWFFMFVTAASGTSLGLLISSIVVDAKTAANFVPLVLIPQLIFGGALIKYEEMNRNLDMIYTFERWFSTHPGAAADTRDDSQLKVPFISYFVATHYTYEALIVAQAKLNPLASRQDQLQRQIDALVEKQDRTEADGRRLEDLKDTLALLSGMESDSLKSVEKRLQRVDKVIAGGVLDADGLRSRTGGVAAERIFTNQKVADLVSKAETEQSDYRRVDEQGRPRPLNVFFSPEKHYPLATFPGISRQHKIGIHTSVYVFNTATLAGASLALLVLLYGILRRQLRPRGM